MKIKYWQVIKILDENNNVKYHTDGNVLYKASKVEYEAKQESTQSPTLSCIENQIFIEKELKKHYTVPLQETMKLKNIKGCKFIMFHNPETNKPVFIAKSLLLKGTIICTTPNHDNKYSSAYCVRDKETNEVIGIVMPCANVIEENIETYKKKVL